MPIYYLRLSFDEPKALGDEAYAVAFDKSADENNIRLAQQLKSLAPQSNEGKDI